jgi:hypothetical protein
MPARITEILDQVLGVVESDILADRIKMTLGAARGVGAIPHSGHDTGDHGSQRQSTGHEQNATGAATGFAGHFVSDEEAESDTGDGLGDADGPADGEILRKFIEGKL